MNKKKIMAKKAMLEKLKKMAMEEDKEMNGKEMKKVTVASPTEKGLEEGLSKAQKIIKARKEMNEGDSDDSDELDMIKSIMKK